MYNGEKYLTNALTALVEQDFEDFELIISDNASTDNTEAICRDLANKDPRIRYARNESNIGLAANHNRTFALSQGQLFKWAAHDDDFPRTMLARFVEVYDNSPESGTRLLAFLCHEARYREADVKLHENDHNKGFEG